MKKITLIASCWLAACATENVADGLHLLQGQKLSTAISYLGYPDAKMELEGSTIYEWSYEHSFTSVDTLPQTFSGNIYGAGGSASYSGRTTAYVPKTVQHHCAVRLMTNENSVIVGSGWKGNEGGCRNYGEGLEKLIEQRQAGGLK